MVKVKMKIRANLEKIKKNFRITIRKLFPITGSDLENALRKLGIEEGDAIFVHSSFDSMIQFDGTPLDVINILLKIIGDRGNLIMPAFSMKGFAKDYLDANLIFDVKKTPSCTGIITEVFRRMEGVKRSIHPTHSIVAFGPRAEWFTENHYRHIRPFEAGTPFEKLCQVNGKVLLLATDLKPITLVHTVEDILKEDFPLKVYLEKQYEVKFFLNDKLEVMKTYVHDPEVSKRRNIYFLYPPLKKRKIFKNAKLGKFCTFPVVLFDAKIFVDEMIKLARNGKIIYK